MKIVRIIHPCSLYHMAAHIANDERKKALQSIAIQGGTIGAEFGNKYTCTESCPYTACTSSSVDSSLSSL